MKIAIIVAVVAVIGAVAGVVSMRGGEKNDANPIEVRVESVSRGDLAEIVSAPGQIQPRTKITISARTTARIVDLPFEEGMTVKKGDLVVKLDSTDLEAALRAAQATHRAQLAEIEVQEARLVSQAAQIEINKAELADAERDLRRQKELLENQDVSQVVVDQAQLRYDRLKSQLDAALSDLVAGKANLTVARHRIEVADAEIARARDNLSYTTITSPIDGIVTRVNAKVGELVVTGTMNNPGTTILEISDLSEMQVDAQVDETNIAAVKDGQKAKVRISAYPDELFDGVVKLVGLDVVDPRSQGGGSYSSSSSNVGRWYRARIVIDTKGKRIQAGLSSDVDIETEVHTKVIKVPTQAVMGRAVDEMPESVKNKPEVDKSKTLATVVFRYEDGKALITPVTIDASDMTHTVISSGLKDGDRVIIGPYKALPGLSDGAKVKETGTTTKPATAATTQST